MYAVFQAYQPFILGFVALCIVAGVYEFLAEGN